MDRRAFLTLASVAPLGAHGAVEYNPPPTLKEDRETATYEVYNHTENSELGVKLRETFSYTRIGDEFWFSEGIRVLVRTTGTPDGSYERNWIEGEKEYDVISFDAPIFELPDGSVTMGRRVRMSFQTILEAAPVEVAVARTAHKATFLYSMPEGVMNLEFTKTFALGSRLPEYIRRRVYYRETEQVFRDYRLYRREDIPKQM